MDWFPIVAVAFKFIVLGTGMFFAVKWHYDQGKKGKQLEKVAEKRAVLRAALKVTALFLVSLVILVFLTFTLASRLGLDLGYP